MHTNAGTHSRSEYCRLWRQIPVPPPRSKAVKTEEACKSGFAHPARRSVVLASRKRDASTLTRYAVTDACIAGAGRGCIRHRRNTRQACCVLPHGSPFFGRRPSLARFVCAAVTRISGFGERAKIIRSSSCKGRGKTPLLFLSVSTKNAIWHFKLTFL